MVIIIAHYQWYPEMTTLHDILGIFSSEEEYLEQTNRSHLKFNMCNIENKRILNLPKNELVDILITSQEVRLNELTSKRVNTSR